MTARGFAELRIQPSSFKICWRDQIDNRFPAKIHLASTRCTSMRTANLATACPVSAWRKARDHLQLTAMLLTAHCCRNLPTGAFDRKHPSVNLLTS